MHRTRALGATIAVATTLVLLSSPASAQVDGFRVDRFEMAPTVQDGFLILAPSVLNHLRWNANATFGLAATTLRVTPDADTEEGIDVVGTRFTTYLNFAIGLFERFEASVQIPVALATASESGMQGGFMIDEASGTALGDIRVGGSVLALGEKTGFQLGATAMMTLPTGSEDGFTGDGGVGGLLQLNAGWVDQAFAVVANAGTRLRSGAAYVTSDQGIELLGRLGVLVPLLGKKLTAGAEFEALLRADGNQSFDDVESPLLALASARYHIGSGWYAGGGVGFGLTISPGSPRWRALATVGYMPEEKKVLPPPPPPPPPPADTDGDGYIDPEDGCPLKPEDFDSFEDKDGCPDPDNDGDRILDKDDKCPRVDGETAEQTAEVYNEHEDEDGCPDEKPLTLEQLVTLPAPIEFEYDKAVLLPGSEVYLKQVLGVLKKYPTAKLEVQGHTSSEGGKEYNQKLSDERAAAVVKWLTDRGTPVGQLTPKGYGLTRPLAPNDTEENRQKNRRVVFVLLNPDEVVGAGEGATVPKPDNAPKTPDAPKAPAPKSPAPGGQPQPKTPQGRR